MAGASYYHQFQQLSGDEVWTILADLASRIVASFEKDINDISTDFLSKKLIGQAEYNELIEDKTITEQQLARKLLSALLSQIRQNHEKLVDLMVILQKKYPLHQELITALENAVEKQKRTTSNTIHTSSQEKDVSSYVLNSPLSKENYKKRFKELLHCESRAYTASFRERCDDRYKIFLCEVKRNKPVLWITVTEVDKYRRFGFIYMPADQVAFVVKGNGAIMMECNQSTSCMANILQENYSHTEDRLYIGFDGINAQKLKLLNKSSGNCEFLTDVKFEPNKSYFEHLTELVSRFSVNSLMIDKIVPDETSFCAPVLPDDFDSYIRRRDFSPDQFEALQAIASCPSEGPPVLVIGPFGTGKTRILAVAARYFLKKNEAAKVLVCTQQKVSASNFLTVLLSLKINTDCIHFIQDHGKLPEPLRKYQKNWQQFKQYITEHISQQIVVISTCLTARFLISKGKLKSGYFTHIFIDEGAQMCEPEAIAPLLMADPDNTKIVIAGDDQQVRSSVSGKIPSASSLALSLLERLQKHYQQIGNAAQLYIKRLKHNFRSGREIVELTASLFYQTEIAVLGNKASDSHYFYKYPLVFVCSNISDSTEEIISNMDKNEAKTITNNLEQIVKGWPKVSSLEVCVISPSQAQLTLVQKCIDEEKLMFLKKHLKYCPTFNFQGKEFQAVVLSTTEPINSDGSAKNPLTSFTNHFIFNTAIARAQSLVVAVGNPIQLLKMEEHMIKKHGEKGKCWSNYIRRSLDNKAFRYDKNLHLSPAQKETHRTQIKSFITRLLELSFNDELTLDPTSTVAETNPNHIVESIPDSESISDLGHTLDESNSEQFLRETSFEPSLNESSLDPESSFELADALVLNRVDVRVESFGTHSNSRSVLNDLHNKKVISKPSFTCTSKDQGYICKVAFVVNETHDSFSVRSDISASKTKAKENASVRAIDQLKKAGINADIDPDQQYVPPTKGKPKLAALKEICDRLRFEYEIPHNRIKETHRLKQTEFQVTIVVKRKFTSEIIFEVTGDTRTSKKDAKHAAAEKAIQQFGNLQTFKILEPGSASELTNVSTPTPPVSPQGNTTQTDLIPQMVIQPTPLPQTNIQTAATMKTDHIQVVSTSQANTPAHSSAAAKYIPQSPPMPALDNSQYVPTKEKVAQSQSLDDSVTSYVHVSRLEEEYEFIREIALGGFGVVNLVKSYIDKRHYALKMIPTMGGFVSERTRQEATVLANVTHDNILRYYNSRIEKAPFDWETKDLWKSLHEVKSRYPYYSSTKSRSKSSMAARSPIVSSGSSGGVVFDHDHDYRDPPTCLCIFTEYCEGGTLEKWLEKKQERKKKGVFRIFDQILSALCYLHGGNSSQKTYIHRDLKPSNVFFKDGIVKVGDFGLVKDWDGDALTAATAHVAQTFAGSIGSSPSVSSHASSYYASRGGTPLYLSPEQWEKKRSNEKVDMYALGLILFELLCPMTTTSEKTEAFENLKVNEFPTRFEDTRPSPSIVIIKNLLQKDPKFRWSAKKLQENAVYKKFKTKMEKNEEAFIKPL